jgi:hypothetical protein
MVAVVWTAAGNAVTNSLTRVRRCVQKKAAGRGGALMRWCVVIRAWGAARKHSSGPIGVFAAAALAACVAGCSSSPSNGGLSLSSAVAPGSTLAFESIDGPPPEVFRKLVASLNDEASARQIAVVSRSAAASYRIRGYVSALVERDKTTFAWVWDVYDTDKRRALRITGQEPAGAGRRRDAWTGADEQVLRRMASNGMEQIASFLSSPASPPAAAPEPNLMTLVSARSDSPEDAGIYRLSSAPERPAAEDATEVPPAPPKTAKTRSAAAVMTDGRAPRQ